MSDSVEDLLRIEMEQRNALQMRVWELEAENEQLRAALDAILVLDAKHDLPDAWKIAGDALRTLEQKAPKHPNDCRCPNCYDYPS